MLNKVVEVISGGFKTTIPTYKLNALIRKVEELESLVASQGQELRKNEPRGKLFSDPDIDWNDPEYKDYKALLEGEKHFDQVRTLELCNSWIKFREFLISFAREYMEASGDDDCYSGDYVEPHITDVNIEHYEVVISYVSSYPEWNERDKYIKTVTVPLQLLWSDWKAEFQKIKDDREAEEERKKQAALEKQKKRQEEYRVQQYERAKKMIEKFEESDGS